MIFLVLVIQEVLLHELFGCCLLELLLYIAVCAHVMNVEMSKQSLLTLQLSNWDHFLDDGSVDLVKIFGPERLIPLLLSAAVFELQVHFQQFDSIFLLLCVHFEVLLGEFHCNIEILSRILNCREHAHNEL